MAEKDLVFAWKRKDGGEVLGEGIRMHGRFFCFCEEEFAEWQML